jgi:predicted small integral membrane protein
MTVVSDRLSIINESMGKLIRGKIFVWLLTTVLLTTAPFAYAQQTGKIARIGFLDSSTASGMAVLVDAFHQELSKLGWIEGGTHVLWSGLRRSVSARGCLRGQDLERC